MRSVCDKLTSPVLVLLGMLTATQVYGQAVRPAAEARDPIGPFRMEIYNGPNRTVHYFTGSLSAGEAGSLRDFERAENELAYVNELQALRRQYVQDERYLETVRRVVQDRLYGLSINTNDASSFTGANYYGGLGYPYYLGGGYGIPQQSYGLSSATSVSRSLAYGVGDEGRLKEALVQAIAAQASPEYTNGAVRTYHTALGRVAESDRLRAVAGVSGRDGRVAPVGFEQPGPITVILKSGEKLEGALVRDDAEWIVIRTPKEELTVRKSEVSRIVKPVTPAKP